MRISNQAQMMIANEDGKVLYHSLAFATVIDHGHINESSLERMASEYFLTEKVCVNSIQLHMAVEKRQVFAETRQGVGVLVLQSTILLFLTGLVILAFCKTLIKPLAVLQEEMRDITLTNLNEQGNDKLFCQYEELSYLHQHFREMRARLNIMIQTEMENQKMYLEEQMKYLQAQINPHFISNTLNVFGIMGIEHGVPEIQNACMQLSSLLQYSISDKAEAVATLAEEIDNIRNYLELMQLRYEHKLSYSIICDEETEDVLLPRLVLEPFIDNIFKHAYSPIHKNVTVAVCCTIVKGRWTVTISDNGKGMTQQQLFALEERINERREKLFPGERANHRKGIGIENTIIRLYLYDPSFTYQIHSDEYSGMQIILSGKKRSDEDSESN
jgi:two-component system sensor histidine kinase YesM